jgi:hypothetical protein
MRSLWRILALQWLGGEGSEALTADSTVLDMLFGAPSEAMQTFDVERTSGVSHQAMMSPGVTQRQEPEIPTEVALRSGLPGG